MLEGSVLIIGDEILAGNVRDHNGHLAADRLRAHGVPLASVHVIPDEFDVIAAILATELRRSRPRLIITSGGIGSTPDDVTFAAIAHCLDLRLVVASQEVPLLDRAIADLEAQGFEVDELGRGHILSMVSVPDGAAVLRHSGWVTGISLDVDGGLDESGGATIVALPGVPEYFRLALDEIVVPDLLIGRTMPEQRVAELHHELPELVLGPELSRLSRRWPTVRIGSYPGEPMVVRVAGPPDDVDRAAADLSARLDDLHNAARQQPR